MAFGPISGDAPFALISPSNNRSIGTLFPDCAVEEIHRDDAQITVHPVETGSPVSDHMFNMPATVELRWFWSNSNAGAVGYVQSIYQQVLAIRDSRELQTITTGKRQYSNMQLRGIMVKTDPESENSLAMVVVAQELILTSVSQAAATAPNTNGSSEVGNVSDPTTPATISAQNAAAAGLSTTQVDGQGFVSFPNGVAPGGNYQLQGVTAPSFGQTAASINPGTF